ncbi:MAG: beta-galactosidase, partial [Anaerolineae bacterium]|nr:beta-galactosidase [Anaerolineae bacterium]
MRTSADSQRFPFLFGAQYYRAPTPEPYCWEADLKKMRYLGFNTVKYWVQWRWSHRQPDSFFFTDLDELMHLASKNDLQVTLNVIFDVAPIWLYKKYPDAKQLMINGQEIAPYTVGHRQIGGHPGPCYSHTGAKLERQKFFKETLLHFRTAPAMKLWDVWNEPELCFPSRQPSLESLVCYCPHCRDGFLRWLEEKYQTLDAINQVWGRCYSAWDEIELPRNTGTITDFIDWREFHMDTLAAEAKWRFDMAKKFDPAHGTYLHIVPNTWFSPVSAADDFSLAEDGEAFGGTMIGQKPSTGIHVTSAAQGKICYNAESHINFGSMNLHQREINLDLLCQEFLPQIGLGVKGFLFWQYRPEVLGVESPAWGLVNLDGTDRPVTQAARIFWQKLSPYREVLLQATTEKPSIAIWRSRANEIFHFCIRGEIQNFNLGIEGWINELYKQSLPFKLINSKSLTEHNLDGIQIL